MFPRISGCHPAGFSAGRGQRTGPNGRSTPDSDLPALNDVYEITPVSGGRSGGLARVASIRRAIRAAVPGVVTTLGGDFLSPSAMGLAVVDGERLAGRQMVSVLNAVGLDWAVLGNHEFDVREVEFLARLGESRFRYLTSNVTDSTGQPFPGTVRHTILRVRGPGGVLRVGMIGLTIDDNQPGWVRLEDPLAAARREVALLRDSVDVIVALTHLSLDQDQLLAESIPEIALSWAATNTKIMKSAAARSSPRS